MKKNYKQGKKRHYSYWLDVQITPIGMDSVCLGKSIVVDRPIDSEDYIEAVVNKFHKEFENHLSGDEFVVNILNFQLLKSW